jgi:lipid-binding SYLF domain-containing protein
MRPLSMVRLIVLTMFLPAVAWAQGEQQQLVDRATLAAQEMLNDRNGTDAQSVLRRSRAVMICPQVFRAGFLLGGQGGSCVLVARDGAGSWSSPAFYGMGGGSIGFQAGVQDAQVMLFIMNEKGLRAVMDSQLKLGADASATFVDLGGGVEGATTAALRADIVGFTRARGLFAGIALGGSLMSSKSDWDQVYYNRAVGPVQIVISMEANNPAADPLRQILSRFGADTPPPPPPAMPAPVPYAAGPTAARTPGGGPIVLTPQQAPPGIQRQTLAPPPRY